MKKNLLKSIRGLIAAAIVFAVIQALISSNAINPYYAQILVLICVNIILAASLNLIIGFTGQLALGHAGFMSVGGYTAAIMTMKAHLPFPAALIAGGLMACIFGFIIGLPTLRLKGDYLAITTLGFGEIIRVLIINIDYLGGPRGLAGIPKKTDFSWAYICAVLVILIIFNLMRSSHGRAMISVREDEIAAEAMGVNTTKYKITAFVIAAFFAGIAGGLYSHFLMFIDPKSFDFLKSMEIVTFVVFGGMGSLSGSVIGATILTALPEALRSFSDYRMVIYSVMLILLMLFRPQGILGTKEVSLDILDRLSIFKKRGDNHAVTGSK
jgi:branched-chain amino acid transport system permease protein